MFSLVHHFVKSLLNGSASTNNINMERTIDNILISSFFPQHTSKWSCISHIKECCWLSGFLVLRCSLPCALIWPLVFGSFLLSRSAWRASLQNWTWPELEWTCTQPSWFRKKLMCDRVGISTMDRARVNASEIRVESFFAIHRHVQELLLETFCANTLKNTRSLIATSRKLQVIHALFRKCMDASTQIEHDYWITRQLILQPNICCRIDFSPKTRLHHDAGIITTRCLLTNTQWEQNHTLMTSTNPPLWASFKCCGSCMTQKCDSNHVLEILG